MCSMVRSTLQNISESRPPLGPRGTLNELVDGKVSIFHHSKENDLESNQSRNRHFGLTSDDEFCVILSWNEHRDDPEQVVWNFQMTHQEIEKVHSEWKMALTMHLDESGISRTYRFTKILAQLCCIWAGECWAPPLTHKVWVPQVVPAGQASTVGQLVELVQLDPGSRAAASQWASSLAVQSFLLSQRFGRGSAESNQWVRLGAN